MMTVLDAFLVNLEAKLEKIGKVLGGRFWVHKEKTISPHQS